MSLRVTPQLYALLTERGCHCEEGVLPDEAIPWLAGRRLLFQANPASSQRHDVVNSLFISHIGLVRQNICAIIYLRPAHPLCRFFSTLSLLCQNFSSPSLKKTPCSMRLCVVVCSSFHSIRTNALLSAVQSTLPAHPRCSLPPIAPSAESAWFALPFVLIRFFTPKRMRETYRTLSLSTSL